MHHCQASQRSTDLMEAMCKGIELLLNRFAQEPA
jgi:hypothetical protein